MKTYQVTGMSCAACSARVEKAVRAVPGVTNVAVSLLTNSMGVEGAAGDQEIIAAVQAAGYGVFIPGAQQNAASEDTLRDTETPKMKKRLFASLGFLLLLMALSMGPMLGLPLPAFFQNDPAALGLAQMLLSGIVLVINQRFFVNGFKGLMHKAPNMDTLVAMGSGAAFLYSVCVLFSVIHAVSLGQPMPAEHGFYFDSAAMILTLITVGKLLEARSKGRTTDALKSLMRLSPQQATVLRDEQELAVPVAQVRVGDIFCVKPGESIPVDGVILEGHTALNESALTGESIPADKQPGDPISAATLNQSGRILCRAVRVGEDTTLSRIIRMVSDAAATKAPIARLADRVSGIFVPVVLGIAAVTLCVWLFLGKGPGFALARAISVLVISCPCALGLATPVAIMVGSGVGAKNGILFKTAVSLEEAGKTRIVALDKTGTLTEGKPIVTDLIPCDGVTRDELLRYAAALERGSEHPLARAVTALAREENVICPAVTELRALPGNGLTAVLDGEPLSGGSAAFIGEQVRVSPLLRRQAEALAEQGKTPLYFCKSKKLLGVIAVADTLKKDSAAAIRELHGLGLKVVMITGDNERTANAIAREAGVDEVIAGVLPDGKARVIAHLKRQGKVMMVGDGINDAPALTTADLGAAIGAGADVAVDAADVVLMKNTLRDVPAAIRLSRRVLRNIRQNLFWAFLYNSLGIPLAAGAFISLLGWQMNPMLGAAAMSLSSFCVVTNALRLNLVNIYDSRRDRALPPLPQTEPIRRVLRIEGMMCVHCEATVKKALESVPGVLSAEASHEKGEAEVFMAYPVPEEKLRMAVEAEEYQVLEIV